MKIVFVYTHHRRTLNYYYPRAARRLGHEVLTVGPWNESMPFGTYGREPRVELPSRVPVWYDYGELGCADFRPDVVWLLDGGEDLRVHEVPSECVLVHQSVEGSYMVWSRGVTPHRYVNFTCNGFAPPDVRWLPYGFDPDHVHVAAPRTHVREYDCAQVGSPRASRRWVWQEVLRRAPDINCWFSDHLWGPAHFALYAHARSTFCNQTLDFACPRVFDALGSGSLLISDRTPAVLSLFEDGVHFLGYDGIRGSDGEVIPDPDWLIETVRRCRRDPDWVWGIARAGRELAWAHHMYDHRIQTVLGDLG